jgi:uncharacterized SAM-binding protein YcdF (DUF218 family)
MSLRVILTDLVIPPASLLYLAFLGVMLAAARRRPRAGVTLGATALALVLALGVPGVGEGLLVSLEGGLPTQPPADTPPQAIVILSAEVDRTTEGLEPGPLTLQRLLAGARLWQRTHLPVLVSGGALRAGETPVAAVMARTLERDFHVPVRWTEPRSETTWENASDSAAMLRPEGIRSVYLVTHAWHERRSVLAFRHFGLLPTVASVPADVFTGVGLPSVSGWSRSYYALHEWAGLLAYSFRIWRTGPAAPASNSAP